MITCKENMNISSFKQLLLNKDTTTLLSLHLIIVWDVTGIFHVHNITHSGLYVHTFNTPIIGEHNNSGIFFVSLYNRTNTACCELFIAYCELFSYFLHIVSFFLHTVSYFLHVVSYVLHIVSYINPQ